MDPVQGAAADPGTLVRVGLPIVNGLIMLGIGMALAVRDFHQVVAAPRALLAGLAGHYLLLPALGFAVAAVFGGMYELAVGFVLVSACPSAAASNALTYLARGNLALAVMLTGASALLSLLSLPLLVSAALYVFAGQRQAIVPPVAQMVGHLLVLVALPVLAGMAMRHLWPRFCARVEPGLNRLGLIGLMLLIAVIVVEQHGLLQRWGPRLLPGTVALCVLALGGGYALGRLVRTDRRDAVTLALEVGVSNCMLAILIAFNVLQVSTVAMPAAIYAVVMYPLAFGFVYLARRRGVAASIPS